MDLHQVDYSISRDFWTLNYIVKVIYRPTGQWEYANHPNRLEAQRLAELKLQIIVDHNVS